MNRQRCSSIVSAVKFACLAGLFFILPLVESSAQNVTMSIDRTEVFNKFGASGLGCSVLSGSNPPIFTCTCPDGNPRCGNISNAPHIEFESDPGAPNAGAAGNSCAYNVGVSSIEAGASAATIEQNYCNDGVFLCAAVRYSNDSPDPLPIDEMQFEIFKFKDDTNGLDPGTAPPLRTFFVNNPGTMNAGGTIQVTTTTCVLFDGSVNIQGEQGKTNGTYGFRVTAKTQVQSNGNNITITSIRAYPSGATRDANVAGCSGGCFVDQKPITVDVTNIHVVRSTATQVGTISGVLVQPYNLTYRLSKDATMYINISNNGGASMVRTLVGGLPRIGEGVPNGTVFNADSWNGRYDNGDLGPSGVYLETLQAFSQDQYGRDLSKAVTRQIELDPLQITDVRVQALTAQSTSVAFVSYEITEPGTVYMDIYPPGTQFCPNIVADPLNSVSNPLLDVAVSSMPPKDFSPRLSNCAGTPLVPLRSFVEQKQTRTPVSTLWDGRDNAGNVLDDGDYVFVLYASIPSQNGFPFNGAATDKRIWTSQVKSGFVPITRGFVQILSFSPSFTVIGSSPAAGGLSPFVFRYRLSRDANVTLGVYNSAGTTLVKTLVNNEMRAGNFDQSDRWETPVGNNGQVVSSGTYLIQLTVADSLFPVRVTTTTALFPVNLFRITDVSVGPLLSGASDFATINYLLSDTMNLALNIYPAGTQIVNTTTTWPPGGTLTPGISTQTLSSTGIPLGPIITIKGLKPGRRAQTEFWDGRDTSGVVVQDGNYVFTLAAQSTTTPAYFASDKIFGTLTVARGAIVFTSFSVKPTVPTLFNSSNTITLHPFSIEYSLTRQSSVTVQVLTTQASPTVVRTVLSGGVREAGILLREVWDGRDEIGNFPRAGFYTVRVTAEDVASALSSGATQQTSIAFDPLRIYDLAITPLRSDSSQAVISYQLSESMKVSLKIYRPGTIFDSAGNPSPAESVSLVKRIVGIKPAQTQIEEFWDGTDLRQSIAPDGSYKFKIVASTDPAAIDTLTGDVINSGSISLDRPIEDVPVVRGASLDPANEFATNTFAYPNPVTGRSAKIQIYVPIQAKVKMSLYNIAGELVYTQDFGEWPSGSCVQDLQCVSGVTWNKVNQAGRAVGRGLYYLVVREEETLGGKNVLQTVKKILIP